VTPFPSCSASVAPFHNRRASHRRAFGVVVSAAAQYLPSWQTDAVAWILNQIIELYRSLLDKVEEYLRYGEVPIKMYRDAERWYQIRDLAESVGGALQLDAIDPNRVVEKEARDPNLLPWSGFGFAAYNGNIAPQRTAAERAGAIADRAGSSMQACANGAMAFYGAFVLAVYRLLTAVGAAIGSIPGGGGAAGALVRVLLKLLQEIVGALAALAGALMAMLAAEGVNGVQTTNLRGLTTNTAGFPGDRWPDPTGGESWKRSFPPRTP
jgi:hypothetical protein